MKILVSSPRTSVSVELGAIIPMAELEKRGLCRLRYKDATRLTMSDIAWCDVLFLVRGTGAACLRAVRLAKKYHRLVFIYWDDNFMRVPPYSLTCSYYSSSGIRSSMKQIFGMADVFFSSSPTLVAEMASEFLLKSFTLPVVQLLKNKVEETRPANNPPIIGYAGGPDHLDLVNNFIGPVIREVAKAGYSFQLHILGPRPDFLKSLSPEHRVLVEGYINNYYDYLEHAAKMNWDIGLAPQVENKFTTYKFYNKFLEYSNIGCAGIYSEVEPYTSVIENGTNGILAKNEVAEWRDALIRLLQNEEMRKRISANAITLVRAKHNLTVVADGYAEALAPYLGYNAPELTTPSIILGNISSALMNLFNPILEYLMVRGFAGGFSNALSYASGKKERDNR
jgi:glycosyltransferase involved in cell wall biosynthesis